LINYFKSYSSLGDDRFLCHPVFEPMLHCLRFCVCTLHSWFFRIVDGFM